MNPELSKDPCNAIGHQFRFLGVVYTCESYDPLCGYWMQPEDSFALFDAVGRKVERRNVSEQAIDSNYKRVRKVSDD